MTVRTGRYPQASAEAREALATARRAKESNEAVLPLAELLHDRLEGAIAENNFADLFLRLVDPQRGDTIGLR